MAKKKSEEVGEEITKEELRYLGSRDLPKKWPQLRPEQCKPFLVKGLSKAKISFREAAFLVFERDPDASDSVLALNNTEGPSSHYYWLKTRYEQDQFSNHLPSGYERLHTQDKNDKDEPVFTPGQIIRYLYNHYKEISLISWAIYHEIDRGTFRGFLPSLIVQQNYQKAGEIIWLHVPKANKDFVIDILKMLPKRIMDHEGLPCFEGMGRDSLSKLISNQRGTNKGGRPTKADILYLTKSSERLTQEVIDLIKKYFSVAAL
ncbi:MAG: hypothetical protein PW788_00755 [Micavibrio sp.]|nr:hypothetical protein [Micavibrio sp.]